jgi:GxxExxY protein
MIVNSEYLHSGITGEILSLAFEVHNYLGCGFMENVYHRSMMVECNRRNLKYESEKELAIYYKNEKVVSRCRPLI